MDTSMIFFGVELSNPEVQSAIISGISNMITGTIPSIVIYFTSRKYLSKKQAESTALKAMQELQFHQAIEREAISNSTLTQRHLRSLVYKKYGLKSNHAFTPKLLEAKITGYIARLERTNPMS